MQKIALVTGANRGLGLETCRQLARAGCRTILTSRDPTPGKEAADALHRDGADIIFYQLDITRAEQVSAIVDFVMHQVGRLDILVNNAGVHLDDNLTIFEISETVIEETLAVNLMGAFRVTRSFLPLMKSQNYGRVVNVSSTGGSLEAMGAMPGRMGAYRISKAALNAMTRVMAGAAKEYNIKINAVCPGWVRTRMGGSKAPRDVSKAVDTILWLATLPASGPTGAFFKDRKRHPW